jgi:hypothetical protein
LWKSVVFFDLRELQNGVKPFRVQIVEPHDMAAPAQLPNGCFGNSVVEAIPAGVGENYGNIHGAASVTAGPAVFSSETL